MSEKESARLFSWCLGGVLVTILLLNFLDRVISYPPESEIRTFWINLIPSPDADK